MTRRPGSETTGLLREDGAQGHVPFAAQPARDAIRASMAPHSARRMLWLSSAGRTMKPRLLDLFCGAGGAARGYQQAGFYVVGVDIKPQPRYAGDDFIQADAMTFPLDGFDAIHASPPCQAYVQRNKNLQTRHPKLIEPTRERLQAWGGLYVIENVLPEVLESPAILCGTQFGLPLRRHRFFETNAGMILSRGCWHWGTVAAGDFAAVYAFGGKGHRHGPGIRDPRSAIGPEWAEAMGIDWMTRDELTQAIPPAYTEYIGGQLMRVIASPALSEKGVSPHPLAKGSSALTEDWGVDGPRDGGGVSPGQQPPPSLNKEPASAPSASR